MLILADLTVKLPARRVCENIVIAVYFVGAKLSKSSQKYFVNRNHNVVAM